MENVQSIAQTLSTGIPVNLQTEEGEFKGSATSMEEDIIAILSSTCKKKSTKRKTKHDVEDNKKPSSNIDVKSPFGDYNIIMCPCN